jgi:MFS family permease
VVAGRRWLNRNVLAIGLADCMADFNYEMVLAVLPLFLTTALGAPVYSVGLVEGVADGSSAIVRVWSGWYSDRIGWRKAMAAGGYATTVAGLGTIGLLTTWPLVVVARGAAWVGRGLRQPIRSSMLAGSVDRADFGKAFGFHESLDTLGALVGPSVAFVLLATGQGFRTVFWVAVVPGVMAVVFFAFLTRDPRGGVAPSSAPRSSGLPASFWHLLVPVGLFGMGNFAPAFFTLRAAEMLQPELSRPAALSTAVLFYLGHQAVGALISFPGGWLSDRLGRAPVLAFAYVSFAAGCLVAAVGHGPLAVALLALPVGLQATLVVSTENALAAALVPERLGGTAFGVLAGVNGAGDLVSSVGAGLLWTAAGAPVALALAAIITLAAAGLLLVWSPRLTPDGPPP